MMDSAKELCRIKKAVKKLIKQYGGEISYPEICAHLRRDSMFMGTYRNLLSQVSSVLKLLVEEGSIKEVAERDSKVFIYAE